MRAPSSVMTVIDPVDRWGLVAMSVIQRATYWVPLSTARVRTMLENDIRPGSWCTNIWLPPSSRSSTFTSQPSPEQPVKMPRSYWSTVTLKNRERAGSSRSVTGPPPPLGGSQPGRPRPARSRSAAELSFQPARDARHHPLDHVVELVGGHPGQAGEALAGVLGRSSDGPLAGGETARRTGDAVERTGAPRSSPTRSGRPPGPGPGEGVGAGGPRSLHRPGGGRAHRVRRRPGEGQLRQQATAVASTSPPRHRAGRPRGPQLRSGEVHRRQPDRGEVERRQGGERGPAEAFEKTRTGRRPRAPIATGGHAGQACGAREGGAGERPQRPARQGCGPSRRRRRDLTRAGRSARRGAGRPARRAPGAGQASGPATAPRRGGRRRPPPRADHRGRRPGRGAPRDGARGRPPAGHRGLGPGSPSSSRRSRPGAEGSPPRSGRGGGRGGRGGRADRGPAATAGRGHRRSRASPGGPTGRAADRGWWRPTPGWRPRSVGSSRSGRRRRGEGLGPHRLGLQGLAGRGGLGVGGGRRGPPAGRRGSARGPGGPPPRPDRRGRPRPAGGPSPRW